jgi:hypothetical protein
MTDEYALPDVWLYCGLTTTEKETAVGWNGWLVTFEPFPGLECTPWAVTHSHRHIRVRAPSRSEGMLLAERMATVERPVPIVDLEKL